MDIYQAFYGKSIFFTGVTGFVGKVLLFKILKEFKDLKHIYVLIRSKENQTPSERFEKEVLSSQCFSPLINEIGEAEWKRRTAKVVPVSGDILLDGLGLSETDAAKVVKECNVIIHLAATVDFMEKLDTSIKMNVLGTIRVMMLAQKCNNIEAVIHTSTCYVNWNCHGPQPVIEAQYPLPFDAVEMCKYVLSIDKSLISNEQERLLKKYNYPNTYALTKRITEHILQQFRSELPLTIVRPAIIGASWKDPCPGWIDSLAAAGGIFLTAGLGVLRELLAYPNYVADIVPVDFVVNTLLKVSFKTMVYYEKIPFSKQTVPSSSDTVYYGIDELLEAEIKGSGGLTESAVFLSAQRVTRLSRRKSTSVISKLTRDMSECAVPENNGELPFVFQSCTSNSSNQLTWSMCQKAVVNYWGKHPHEKAISKCDIVLTPSLSRYYFRWYMYRKIPFELMKIATKLPPPVGGPEKQNLIKRYERVLGRASDLNHQFKPFTLYQWFYDASNSKLLDEGISVNNFSTDVCSINWPSYIQRYQYGIIRFIMNS